MPTGAPAPVPARRPTASSSAAPSPIAATNGAVPRSVGRGPATSHLPAHSRRRTSPAPSDLASGLWQRIRASAGLLVIAVALGMAMAAGFSLLVWVIASALHHAAAS